MSYKVTIYNRDFTKRVQPAVKIEVDRLEWASIGGASLAQAHASGDQRELFGLVQLLRCPVVVASDQTDDVWWGYLDAVAVDGITVSLSNLSNRIQAGYTVTFDAGGTFTTQRYATAWAEDLGSQADYGIKEKLIAAGGVTLERATSQRDQALTQDSRPMPAIALNSSKGQTPSAPTAALSFKGWYSTLDWRYYSNAKGFESYTTEGIGTQVFGDQGTTHSLAQKFSCPTYGWVLDTLYVKMAKAGAPADNVGFYIEGDSAGNPDGVVQASGVVPSSSISLDYSWVKVTVTPAITIGSGSYWLYLYRFTALDLVNYFKVKVNESLGYPRGAMKIWNGGAWVARNPAAAMNFNLQGKEETTLQIADIGAAAACGQFISAIRIEDASGLYQTPYRAGLKTGMQEIAGLLASGTSAGAGLVAEVTKERILRVFKRPVVVGAWLGEDGVIRDAYGQVMGEDKIINKVLKIEKPGLEMADTQFITRVEADGEGKLEIYQVVKC